MCCYKQLHKSSAWHFLEARSLDRFYKFKQGVKSKRTPTPSFWSSRENPLLCFSSFLEPSRLTGTLNFKVTITFLWHLLHNFRLLLWLWLSHSSPRYSKTVISDYDSFGWEGGESCTSALLRAQHSVTPSKAPGTIHSARHRTWVSHIQGKRL